MQDRSKCSYESHAESEASTGVTHTWHVSACALFIMTILEWFILKKTNAKLIANLIKYDPTI